MNVRRILIVSASYFPENSPRAFRTTELSRELSRKGHAVTVLLPSNNNRDRIQEFDDTIHFKFLGDLRFTSLLNKRDRSKHFILRVLRRTLLLLFEFPYIELMPKIKRALKNESGYDLLISIAVPYPVHWGVAWARDKRNKIGEIWVADCGDPYMGCKTDTFKKPFYFKYVEKWFCRKADYLSVPNEDHFGQYYPEFRYKMKAISQGFRFEDTRIYDGPIKHSVPTFAFAGVLIKGKRDPTILLEYISSLPSDFKFILFTERDLSLIEPFKARLGKRIQINHYVKRSELIYILSQVDFLLNIEFNSIVGSNSPSKLIDYAIAGRPVLSLSMERMNIKLIDEFLAGDYSGKADLGDTNRFRIEFVANQFTDLLS